MATPADSTPPATTEPTSAATAGQNNGGGGTVDHGPYPSQGPISVPTGAPNQPSSPSPTH
jgi:hypothetical protein